MLGRFFRSDPATIPPASGPAGERLYAVGDIHGRLDLLDQLLQRIVEDLEQTPPHMARLVFLGDYIDRGPESAGVINRLVQLATSKVTTHFLMGNHEEMLMRVLAGEPWITYEWLRSGGDMCAMSYGLSQSDIMTMEDSQIAALLRQALPEAHLDFFERLSASITFGDFLLVHAGIRPGVSITDQCQIDMRWIRRPFLTDKRYHGVLVVHGHTVTKRVDYRHNRIGIDTGAYHTGVLTALVVETTKVRHLDTR